MVLGLLLFWSVLLPGSVHFPQVESTPETQSTQSQSNETQGETRSAEHAPTAKTDEQQTKPEPPSHQAPSQPVAQPQTNPPDQAPQAPQAPNPEVKSKPGEVAPAAKPEGTAPAKPAKTTKHKSKKHKSTSGKSSGPKKVIVRDGGTGEAFSQLAPDMSTEEASHARETTSQLLSSTESNLQRASTRALNQDQQATVEQIRTFIGQSNAAVKAGDLQRGHNLALKALLLSNDLVKH
jgi:hypothetical protein